MGEFYSLSCGYIILQDGWKPIQTAAASDCRDVVEILFPLTSPVTSISNWSIDGIFEQVRQATHKEVVWCNITQHLGVAS